MTDKKIISTGRGGAGNLRKTQADDEYSSNEAGLPQLQGKRFTTGRGGAGNMMDNIDPDSTRAAQDEHDLPDAEFSTPLSPHQSLSVGRGGFGNQIKYKQAKKGSDGENKSFCEKISSAFS